MRTPRFLAVLACGAAASMLIFHVFAAEPVSYELTQAVSVTVSGQNMQLPAGQPVIPLGAVNPGGTGSVMIRITLPDGSLSIAQVPAANIRAKNAAPAPAPVVAAAPAPAVSAPAPATVTQPAPATAAAPEKHNRNNRNNNAAKTAQNQNQQNQQNQPGQQNAAAQQNQQQNQKPQKETAAVLPKGAPLPTSWPDAPPERIALPPILVSTASSGSPFVPLYDNTTKLDPDVIVDTPEAIITRVGDRARDRHAREWMFHAYDHYLKLYWMNRTDSIEIVDRVAKGGDSITFNITSLFPLNHPNLRMFFQGKGTVAQYSDNTMVTEIDPLHYTETIKVNTNERRPLKVGDRLEFEFSPFLKPPVEGRTNYYGTSTLYVVGQGGTQPWEWHTPVDEAEKVRGAAIDSYPLPDSTWMGGRLTLPQQYSDEPKARFQQIATNMAPIDIQPFMLGRRIHHTDFGTGKHSEADNPVYTEMAGKLGPQFVGRSCIGCHEFNGAALPAGVSQPMTKYAIHVGIDAQGTPHPDLGSTLQTQANPGAKAEGDITIASWGETAGTFADGTPYSLQKPTYKFTGITPPYFSVRLAPKLVGEGLLESIDENTISSLAAQPNKPDGITGHVNMVKDPITGVPRIGRYGWKASQATLTYQIAAAFNNDMGVTTTVFPHRDRGAHQPDMDPTAQPAPTQVAENNYQKVSYDPGAPVAPVASAAPAQPQLPAVGPTVQMNPADLGNLYRYIALLGVPPQRNYADPDVIRGKQLFAKADCAVCHVDTVKTSQYHPLAELRSQVIHPYTDMLVHNMGPGLADNMGDGQATGAEWRTAPLWSVGLSAGVSSGEGYLHDGRARNLNEAILWHGGEAEKAKENFRNMPAADRAALIKFLQSL